MRIPLPIAGTSELGKMLPFSHIILFQQCGSVRRWALPIASLLSVGYLMIHLLFRGLNQCQWTPLLCPSLCGATHQLVTSAPRRWCRCRTLSSVCQLLVAHGADSTADDHRCSSASLLNNRVPCSALPWFCILRVRIYECFTCDQTFFDDSLR